MTTTADLKGQQAALQARYDNLFAELTPKARAGSDGRMRWRDVDLSQWLGLPVDSVRLLVVRHLLDFAVGGEDCSFALLTTVDVLALLQFKSARAAEIGYVLAELSAVENYLRDLDLDGSEP
jgi:hypothetical protein